MKRFLFILFSFFALNTMSAQAIYNQVNNIEVQQTADFDIAPNPAKNKLNIRLSSKQSSDLKIEVFDVLGKRVYKGIITELSSSINVSNWKSGVYLVRLFDDNNTKTKRFIKN